MKKMFICLVGMVMAISLAGCGGQSDAQNGGSAPDSSYTSAVQVLETVIDTYTEEQKFPIGGGDSENLTSEVPGASMVHMMNANTFTGAAYRLKSGVQVEEFSEAVKENVLAKQWMCGMPDTMVVIDVDGQYVLTAYGADELIETFKTNALSALDGAKVVLDAPVVENGF